MPGLMGAVQPVPSRDMAGWLARIHTTAERADLYHEGEIDQALQWVIGRIQVRDLDGTPQLAGRAGLRVLLHGELTNAGELRAMLGWPAGAARDQEVIAALYLQYGDAFAAHLDGSFAIAVLDPEAQRIALATDRIGSRPLYWRHDRDRLVFGSELKWVTPAGRERASPDESAIADFLTFGFILGDKTLVDGVSLVPPGHVVTYSWADDISASTCYASLADLFGTWSGTRDEYLEEVCGRFQAAVRRALDDHRSVGLALSGGLDSRAVLAAATASRAGSVATYTLGASGCADEVIAAALARIAGVAHRFLELNGTYLSRFLADARRLVHLTDGMYVSHGLTEMLALQAIAQSGVMVLLRGHGGELAKTDQAWPLHTDATIRRLRSREEVISYLLARMQGSQGALLGELFSADVWARLRESARDSLERCTRDIPLAPADLCSYLYLHEHVRRYTVPSLELLRERVEVRVPFLDRQFLRVLFEGESRWREGTEIHRYIIRRCRPELLRVRNSNTGAPADASPLREAVTDKLNTALKRLNVRGYRHYHNFSRWMRDGLLESVEEVLLDPGLRLQTMLRGPVLRRLIDATRRGEADHGYLLQTLLILELWYREHL